MVDTPYNRQGLHSFQGRMALSPPENRITKMENKINQAVRGTPEPSVSHGRRGWKSRNFSQLPVEAEIFLLTFPFIEQAIALTTRSMHYERTPRFRRLKLSVAPPALRCAGEERKHGRTACGKSARPLDSGWLTSISNRGCPGEWHFTLGKDVPRQE
jgi:hypothetical protein